MKKLIVVTLIITASSCTKKESKQCVCRDYGNSQQEVDRVGGIDGSQCAARQIDWMQIKPDVRCNLE